MSERVSDVEELDGSQVRVVFGLAEDGRERWVRYAPQFSPEYDPAIGCHCFRYDVFVRQNGYSLEQGHCDRLELHQVGLKIVQERSHGPRVIV